MNERLRRWRLVLGADEADGIGDGVGGGAGDGVEDGAGEGTDGAGQGLSADLSPADARRDKVLEALYDSGRSGTLATSAPRVARWLGDIRTYFPSTVVQVMQRDAMDRLGLRELLLEPELLASVQPDVSLAATLVGLNRVIPERSRETARAVVRRVVQQLEERLDAPSRRAITGALNRAVPERRPRPAAIDWNRTVAANLSRYQPEYRTVIPERLVGYSRRARRVLREVVLCIDQSGSMATSVVYASVFAAVLASLPTLDTRLVAFSTSVVDLTYRVADPVDVLFGVQLGGGTDIAGALGYCASRITRPRDTVLVLISDLFEGGPEDDLLRRVATLVESGTQVVVLLALNDEGAPSHDHDIADALAGLGVSAFACTPDLFPDLMAAAIHRRNIGAWAAAHGIVTGGPERLGPDDRWTPGSRAR